MARKGRNRAPEWYTFTSAFLVHFYFVDNILSEYEALKAGKKTKDDLVKDVLQRVYSSGKDKGKTVEQYYMDQYKGLSGAK